MSDTEKAVLGAMLVDNRCIGDVAEVLGDGKWFDNPAHRHAYAAALDLFNDGTPVDTITLPAELTKRGQLESIGLPAIVEWAGYAATGARAAHHASIVLRTGQKRHLADVLSEARTEALSEMSDPMEIMDRVEGRLLEMAGTEKQQAESLGAILPTTMGEVEEAHNNPGRMGIPTSLSDLDDITGGWHNTDLVILAARPSVGKAQPITEPVITPSGARPIGSLKPGDLVAGVDGKFHKVTGVFPRGVRPIFKVRFTDGPSVLCCDEHLWETSTRAERKANAAPSVRSLKEIRETLWTDVDTRLNHSCPEAEPVQFPKRGLPVDPYLLGVWIGDGHCSGSSVRITNPEPDMLAKIEGALPAGDTVTVTDSAARCRSIRIRKDERGPGRSVTYEGLKVLGLHETRSHTKFIPTHYMLSDVDSRTALLQGILDSDGHVVRRNEGPSTSIEFATTSPELAKQVCDLVRSLGGRCSNPKRSAAHYTTADGGRVQCRDKWRCAISFPQGGIVPVTSEKHLAHWSPRTRGRRRMISHVAAVGKAPCVCISVDAPRSLYLTKDYVPTHNTALGLGNALAAAERGPVAVYGLEMSKNQYAMRLLSMQAKVDLHKMRTGRMGQGDWQTVTRHLGQLAELPIYIDDTPGMSPLELRAKARRLKGRHGLSLVVVDYLQLMRYHEKTQSREQEVSKISQSLKNLAKELNVPVLALSQLSRASEARSDKRPILADLRDSGAIEQDADTVVFIHPQMNGGERTGVCELIVAKQRSGPVGSVYVQFDAPSATFQNLAHTEVR